MVKQGVEYVEAILCLVVFYIYDLQCRLVGDRVRGKVPKIPNSIKHGMNASGQSFSRIGFLQHGVDLKAKSLCV